MDDSSFLPELMGQWSCYILRQARCGEADLVGKQIRWERSEA